MFIRTKKRGDKVYLQIVENHRENKKVVQKVRATLGRLDVLQETGQIDALLRSGLRFSQKLTVLDAHAKGECTTTDTVRIGAVLLFKKLWQDCSIGLVLKASLQKRRFDFPVERVIFAVVLSRLINPGSDRGTYRWIEDYAIPGMNNIGLHHFYRAMGWLGGTVSEESHSRKFGKNSVAFYRKDLIEESLFSLRRDLFSEMELVFFDTTTLYFEGEGGESIGRRGKSKDHRPDLKQMVVGVILDGHGNPVCSELLPGNTTDVTTLIPISQRLQERFGVKRICIVADRGMISKTTITELEKMGWEYILGARLRKVKEIREEVLSRGGRFREVYGSRQKSSDPAPLKVKEVQVNDNRYIICHNEEEARKDRYDREMIVTALQEKLKQGDKSFVGNKGFRRYLKSQGKSFQLDTDKVSYEERFDGKYVLKTNTELSAEDVAVKYKQLWTVETIFRTMKSILETRPIFHHGDDTIRGHVFCSFLALVLRKKLQNLLDEKGLSFEWEHIVRDIDKIEEVNIVHNNQHFSSVELSGPEHSTLFLRFQVLAITFTSDTGIFPKGIKKY